MISGAGMAEVRLHAEFWGGTLKKKIAFET
jgi:hypothetical protein